MSCDRTALHAVRRTPATFGVGATLEIAIIARVGINQTSRGAVLLCEFRFQPTPSAAITRDDDLAAYVDATSGKGFVVIGHTVVGIDEFGGHIAVAAIDVVWWQDAIRVRGRIARQPARGASPYTGANRAAATIRALAWGTRFQMSGCARPNPKCGTPPRGNARWPCQCGEHDAICFNQARNSAGFNCASKCSSSPCSAVAPSTLKPSIREAWFDSAARFATLWAANLRRT